MNRSEMMVTRAARNIQKRIPQIWKEMELDLPDDYWGVMGDWGDMLKAQRDRVYNFESRVFDEMWEETEKFDKREQQKLYKLTDLMLKKFLKSPAAKHPTVRLKQRPAGTLRYFPSLDGKKNPVKPRKGESERKFVSRCMSEEKKSFPKQKQRIAVCLSKARKNPFNDRNLDA
jgi:hypothetical protein